MDQQWLTLLKGIVPVGFIYGAFWYVSKFYFVPRTWHYPEINRKIIVKDQSAMDSVTNPDRHFIKVMSYNILADKYASLLHFKYARKGILNFSYRSNRIFKEISESNCDVICLQEVDHIEDFYRHFLENLGYEFYINLRRKDDAVLLGFKKDKFKFQTVDYIDYNDLVEAYGSSYFKKDNKAVLCLVEHVPSKEPMLLVSSHLHWNPKYDYIKYAQTNYLLKRISQFKHANNLDDIATIVCGDFNSLPDASSVSLIYNERQFRNNKYASEQNDIHYGKIWQSYESDQSLENIKGRLKSAYDTFRNVPEGITQAEPFDIRKLTHPPHTNYVGWFQETLVYIFYTDSKLNLVSILDLPAEKYMKKEGGLPNPYFPSDHIRVEAFNTINFDQKKQKIQIPLLISQLQIIPLILF